MFSKFLGSPTTKSSQNESNDSIDIEIVSVKLVCGDNITIQSTRIVAQTTYGSQSKGPAFETKRVIDHITVGTSATKVWAVNESCIVPKDLAVKVSFQIIGTINNVVDMVIAELNTPLTLAGAISPRSFEIELQVNREIVDVLNSVVPSSSGATSISPLKIDSPPIFKAFLALRVRACQGKQKPSAGLTSSQYLACVSTVDESRIGALVVRVLEGKRLNTICPCHVAACLLHERARGHRSSSPSNPHAPIFDFAATLDIPSFQCDALIEVFEESLSGPNLLGQVIVPVQWLLPTTLAPESPRRCRIEPTWLEVFPPMRPTLFNDGGKYRPHMRGLPLSTGYGLPRTEKAVGFLRMELELELKEPLHLALMRDPWKYAAADSSASLPAEDEASYGPMTSLNAVMVAGYTVLSTYHYLENQPVLKKLNDILAWRTSPELSMFVFFTSSYMALLASPWQYPLLFLLLLLVVSLAAARQRTFEDVQVFDAPSTTTAAGSTAGNSNSSSSSTGTAQSAADSSSSPKAQTYTEMYREVTVTAVHTERSVAKMAAFLTRANNIVMWSDPLLSLVAYLAFLLAAAFMSLLLCVFSTNQTVWFVCLSQFTPPEFQDHIVSALMARVVAVSQLLSSSPGYDKSLESSRSKQAMPPSAKSLSSANGPSPGAPGAADGKKRSLTDSDSSRTAPAPAASAPKMFTYSWVKHVAWRWVQMAPDDLELKHRRICRLAVVPSSDVQRRIPPKVLPQAKPGPDTLDALSSKAPAVPQSGSSDWLFSSSPSRRAATAWVIEAMRKANAEDGAAASTFLPPEGAITSAADVTLGQAILLYHATKFISDGRQSALPRLLVKRHAFRLKVRVNAARGLGVKESGKMMGEIAAFSSKIYAQLSVTPSSAHPDCFRTAGQPRSPTPSFREDFLFEPIGEGAVTLEVSLVMKDAIQTRVGIDYFLGAAVVPLFTLFRKPRSHAPDTNIALTSAWRRVDVPDSGALPSREEPAYVVQNLATGEPVSPLHHLALACDERYSDTFGFAPPAGADTTEFRSVTDWFPLRSKASVPSNVSVPKEAAIQLTLTLTATELLETEDQSG